MKISNILINEHYIVYREDAVNLKGDQKGLRRQNKFLLHPNVFKKCLIRSLKIDKYADYYLLLKKALKYYNEYQKLKMQNKIEKLEGTLNNRVILPSCKHKIENLAIVYLEEDPEYHCYVIRGQIKHIRKQLKRFNKTDEDVIAAIDTPNSVSLWIQVKEKLDEHLKLDRMILHNNVIHTGYFRILNMSEKEFIRSMNEINKEKFNY